MRRESLWGRPTECQSTLISRHRRISLPRSIPKPRNGRLKPLCTWPSYYDGSEASVCTGMILITSSTPYSFLPHTMRIEILESGKRRKYSRYMESSTIRDGSMNHRARTSPSPNILPLRVFNTSIRLQPSRTFVISRGASARACKAFIPGNSVTRRWRGMLSTVPH